MTSAPESFSGQPAQTLLSLLVQRVAVARMPAATHKVGGRWKDVSWAEVQEQVQRLAAGLVALGVQRGDRVALFARTSLTWLTADLAISAAGAVTVPVYDSNTVDETRYILEHSQAVALLVDDDVATARQPGRLTRARQACAAVPGVKHLVVFEAACATGAERSLDALIAGGAAEDAAAWGTRVALVQPNDLCHFIYTSGTTGHPKGVMLSHGNWAYEAWALQQDGSMQPDDAVMLFLPLAHSFAQVIKTAWLAMGFRLVFAQSVETVVEDLADTRPTILPSVPRVFEKVFSSVQSRALAQSGVNGAVTRWAFKHFDQYAASRDRGERYDSLSWRLAQRLVFKKVRAQVDARLGGRMRLFISGGAPLPRKIAWFFDLLGLVVLEGYGLTETSAAATVNRLEKVKIGTVGAAIRGTEVKLAPDGEVLIRGPGVMKGYHRDPAATAEAIDPEGWFHSGDIGTLDADGWLSITDRKKDLIITAGGKNIAPQNLESQLKAHPIISSAMVYGDRRPYLTALVCVTDDGARKVLAGATLPYAELGKQAAVLAAVQAAIDGLNATLPPYSTVKKFTVMDHDFTQESGELTPTLKVKRKLCTQRYSGLLEQMYEKPAGG